MGQDQRDRQHADDGGKHDMAESKRGDTHQLIEPRGHAPHLVRAHLAAARLELTQWHHDGEAAAVPAPAHDDDFRGDGGEPDGCSRHVAEWAQLGVGRGERCAWAGGGGRVPGGGVEERGVAPED